MCDACTDKLQTLIDNDPRPKVEGDMQRYPDISAYLQQLHTQMGAVIKQALEANNPNEPLAEMLSSRMDELNNQYTTTIDNHVNGREQPQPTAAYEATYGPPPEFDTSELLLRSAQEGFEEGDAEAKEMDTGQAEG